MSTRSRLEKWNRDSIRQLAVQFFKFGLVGVSNTLIGLAVYYGSLALGVHYLLANVLGFVVSVLNAYFWNRNYVFKKGEGQSTRALLRTFVAYGGTFALSTVLLYVMVHDLTISQQVAPLLNLLITVPLNFVLNKYWTFQPDKGEGKPNDEHSDR